MKKVTIHQANYLPWLGFFHKINHTDTFVILDDVQYSKNQLINRNKIRTPQGWCYLTIPIERKYYRIPLKEVKLPKDNKWKNKHWKSIEMNYKKAPFFNSHYEFFKKSYEKDYETLMELNCDIIKYLIKVLKIEVNIIKSSDLDYDRSFKKTDLLLDILLKINADCYLSGIGLSAVGKKHYLETNKFKTIKLEFQTFKHPVYKQVYKDFIPNLSAIDFLFNTGGKGFHDL